MRHAQLHVIKEWQSNQKADPANDGAEVYCIGFFRLFPEGATEDQLEMLRFLARRYHKSKLRRAHAMASSAVRKRKR